MDHPEMRWAQDLSALLDDELERHEFVSLARRLGEAEVQQRWQTYTLIGDSLRGDAMTRNDFVAAVMARLEEEPIVLAPRALPTPPRRLYPALALAASLAGIAIVAWLAIASGVTSETLARHPATIASTHQERPSSTPAVAQVTRPNLEDYLFAHHAQASAFRYGEGVQQVRAVSYLARDGQP